MEVPRLGIQSEKELPAYTTATATSDPSHVCDLHHNSQNAGSLTHRAWPGIEPATTWYWEFSVWRRGNESDLEP